MTTENRNNRWAPEEDDLFRKMAEAGIRPEVIAAKLNRSNPGRQGTGVHDWASA